MLSNIDIKINFIKACQKFKVLTLENTCEEVK